MAAGMAATEWQGRRSDTEALLRRRVAAGWTGTRVSTGRLPGGRRSSTRYGEGDSRRSSFGFEETARQAGERIACNCRGGCLRGIALVQMTGGSALERGRSVDGLHDSLSPCIAGAGCHLVTSQYGSDLLVSRGRLGRLRRLRPQGPRSAV
jgi:hypothetical protein